MLCKTFSKCVYQCMPCLAPSLQEKRKELMTQPKNRRGSIAVRVLATSAHEAFVAADKDNSGHRCGLAAHLDVEAIACASCAPQDI